MRLFELAWAASGMALGCSSCSRGGAASEPPPVTIAVPPPPDGGRPGAGDTGSADPAPAARRCPDADWHPLHGLSPARPVDFAAIMERLSIAAGPATERWAIGDACATAARADDCRREIERLAASVTGGRLAPGQVQSEHFLITTQGDEVRAWTSREQWLAFLGRIDTPDEALLLAWYDLYEPACVEPRAGGYRVSATKMTKDCPIEITDYQLDVSADGQVTVSGSKVAKRSPVCVGRRPPELLARTGGIAADAVATYFADVARLEAAAVFAFQKLAAQLERWRAPARLVKQCRRAAGDEVRHARLMGRLALQLGAEPQAPALDPPCPQGLREAALDNAVEGCVRETFGAIVGSYQALCAQDARVRRALRAVAADERRHAAFSWALHRWFRTQLSARDARLVEAAQARALAELREEWAHDPHPDLMAQAGLPRATLAAKMVDGLAALA